MMALKYDIKLPLVEKYRPVIFTDLLFDKFLRTKIKNILDTKQIPNMIITGEPSTGKTSTILLLARDIYKNNYRDHVLELNASDDRGLTMIQQTIIPFCKKKTNQYKLIILDEADSITNKAQNLLNNIIADFKEETRFVFICNDRFKINESIQSRCMILYFPRIDKQNLKDKLKTICDNEKFKYNENGIKKLLFSSNYDIRQCINNLECIMYNKKELTEETVNSIIDIPNIYMIKDIIKYSQEKNLNKVLETTQAIYNAGFSSNDIILTFMKYIENKDDDEEYNLTNDIKVYKILSDSFIKVNLIDNFVQLMACITQIYKLIN
jgi:replication factor C subunit 2/4